MGGGYGRLCAQAGAGQGGGGTGAAQGVWHGLALAQSGHQRATKSVTGTRGVKHFDREGRLHKPVLSAAGHATLLAQGHDQAGNSNARDLFVLAGAAVGQSGEFALVDDQDIHVSQQLG